MKKRKGERVPNISGCIIHVGKKPEDIPEG